MMEKEGVQGLHIVQLVKIAQDVPIVLMVEVVEFGPSTDYEILQSLPKGSLVYFKEKKGEWALVKVMETDRDGYVSLKYLK